MFRLSRSDLPVTVALVVVALLLAAVYAWPWTGRSGAEAGPAEERAPHTATIVPPAAAPPGVPAQPEAAVMAVTAPAAAPAAQDDTFVQAVAADADFVNPVLGTGPANERVAELIYPRLVGQDPNGGYPVPTELAEGWTFSPDGGSLTLTLRSNVFWSDGRPVTAADVKFTYDALANEAVASPFWDRSAAIGGIAAPDLRTVVLTLRQPACSVLLSLRRPLLPSHRYASDLSDLRTNPLNTAPTVGAGPFLFAERVPGARIVLSANPGYWKGTPRLARYVLEVLPDAAARRQALLDGRVDLVHFAPEELIQDGLPGAPGIVAHPYPAGAYSVVAVNLADPGNPQSGRDATGLPVAQPPHPILGDTAVRQALAAGLDYDRILDEILRGNGIRMASYVPGASWAAADLPPVAHDPAAAAQRLAEAGWIDGDGDGVRERAGVPLRLALLTNADNALRVALAEAVAAQLRPLGMAIEVAPVSFEELATALLDQRFDLAVIGWENVGSDPANSPFWHSREDQPGEGFNFTSFQDGEVDDWLDAADAAPACAPDARGALYRQVQARLDATRPYLFLGGHLAAWAYDERWQGIAPAPWSLDYNVQDWRGR